MNFLDKLGRAVAALVIIGVWVLLGSLGSCAIANAMEGTSKAGWVMAIGAFVGLVLGVVVVSRLFRRS